MPVLQSRWRIGAVVVAVLIAAASASAQERRLTRMSWGPVQIGPNQQLHLNVAYAPSPRDGATRPPVRVRVEFDLYRADGAGGSAGTVRLIFVERRVTDLTLAPGEAVSVGGEMISGYSASHLSLLGLANGDLEEAGISVTGDLTNRLEGTTTTIVQLRPCD